ncbi:Predicted arabinose efflux permease, MFS family [Noviherbaspirillum humi]|uniref:Predicted arabinose efflux permease, MFS family n=1 Tax=Noviherbaspirillum humi TaxID=1688639 RepID=A0A239F637_9BURK|nr:MFS transporter [Noviherbaspirillum humi]SNS51564.1 Predicted arabinose efflux permease, MFS family [Noviherbaspirillum humi]
MRTATGSRWYFGWNVVAAATLLTLLTVGMRLGIGPFFLPMAQDLGFSRSLLAGIIAIGMLCYGLAMPLAGYLVGRWGTRAVLLTGAAIVVAATVWTVMARTPATFLLSFGVAMSVGLAFTSPVALTPVISRWFTRQRGMALFFLSTGSMAGMAVMTPVLTWAIDAFGWQHTLLGFAAGFVAVVLPSALFVIRDEAPRHADLLPEQIAAAGNAKATAADSLRFGQAVKTGPFWKIFLGLFACGFSMNLLGTHGVPMLMDHGFDAMTSSYGIGVIGFVAIFGTLILGRISDRLPRRNILATIYFIRGLGFFALLLVGTHWELYLAAAIGGMVWAGSIASSSAILADVYGVRLVGTLYGTAYLGHQIGAMLSSWLGGWGFETFGSHWIAFGASGGLLLAAAVLSLRLPEKGFMLRAAPLAAQAGRA